MLLAKRYGRIRDYDDWCKPRIVENALDILDEEIPVLKHKIKSVHLCFTTDPFMKDYGKVAELSLKIIYKLNKAGIRVTTLTKGIYPEVIYNNGFLLSNEYGITIVSLKEDHRAKYEPNAFPYEERIDTLRKIHDAGLKTWVSIEPYPTPNIVKQDLDVILKKISFVDKIIFGRLNYCKEVGVYLNQKAFYNECSEEVIRFCRNHDIAFHIKNGTITN